MTDQFDVSVIAPCLNEEGNLPALAQRLFASVGEAGIRAELVLVDDGSTDDTPRVIQQLHDEYGDAVVGVRHPGNRGIAAAWRSGLDASHANTVCFIDADLQNPPEEVVRLYRNLMESRYDLVQGSRSTIGRVRDSRLLYSKSLNFLLNRVFGMRARDNKSGFVLGPRMVFEDVLSYRRRYAHFQTFITVAAHAKGYSVLEVETLFQSRNAGHSFIDTKVWRVVASALRDFVPAFTEFRLQARPRHGTGAVPGRRKPSSRHPYRGWRRLLFETYFLTMPAHKWLIRRRARELYLDLKQTEWLAEDAMQALQLAKLRRLLQHAYVHVPYYRRAMQAAGLRPEDVESLDDLARMPMLSKDDVRRHLHFDLFADNHVKRDMHRVATSGSTGEPFVTYADRHQLEMRFATTLRAAEWTGWRFGDPQVRLWHQTLGMTRSQVIRERIDAMFMRRLFIPAFEIGESTLDDFVEQIRAHQPVLVDGYAESFNFLASYVREGGRARFSPKAVMSSAQALPDSVREAIEQEFDTKVYDKYGSREFSGIAYQCGESRDHHVMDESYIVELLVDGRAALPGEVGEVVITDLNNYSVPLIRYRIGDLAAAVDSSTPCSCGRAMSRVGRIEGRTLAIVHCGNGVWIPGTFFAHLFKDYEYAVRYFQIFQDRKGAFTLRIVKNTQFTDDAIDEVLRELRRYVGDASETEITLEFVDEIPLLATGKRSAVVSTVGEDFQHVRGVAVHQQIPRAVVTDAGNSLDAAAYDEQWARLGDFLRYNPGARHRRRLVRKALASSGFSKGSVLDVGCGLGEMVASLADAFPGAEITGVDLSPLAIERCRRDRPRQQWAVADVTTDELPSGFDAVVCSEVLEHLEHPGRAVDNLARAVRPGGVVVITVPHGPVFATERAVGHLRHPSFDDLDAWCRAAGLAVDHRWCWGWPAYALVKRVGNVRPEAAMAAFGSGDYSASKRLLNDAAYMATFALSMPSARRGVQTVLVARKPAAVATS